MKKLNMEDLRSNVILTTTDYQTIEVNGYALAMAGFKKDGELIQLPTEILLRNMEATMTRDCGKTTIQKEELDRVIDYLSAEYNFNILLNQIL